MNKTMERPKSIFRFERLFLIALATGIGSAAIQFKSATQAAEAGGFGMSFVIFIQAFVFALMLSLVLLISRRASRIAKWVLIILFVCGLPQVYAMLTTIQLDPVVVVVGLVQFLLQTIALGLLFTREAEIWLDKKWYDAVPMS